MSSAVTLTPSSPGLPLDLHGGDLSEALVPFSLFPAGSDASKALAAAFGLPVAVSAGGEGYTINAAARIGVPGIIAEVGGNGLWDEAGVVRMTDGAQRDVRELARQRDAIAQQLQTLREALTAATAPLTGSTAVVDDRQS